MPSITHRPYQTESDLHVMLGLLQRCRATGQIISWPAVADLREICHPARTDWEKHLWLDATEKLIGFALLHESGAFSFYAYPAFQDSGVETQILSWAIEQRRALGPDHAEIRCQAREDDLDRIAFLKSHGFT